MRTALAVGLVPAVCFIAPGAVTGSWAASDSVTVPSTPTPHRQEAAHPLKPIWQQCFDMSINRGFNHDTEEWQQSIRDCIDGKIKGGPARRGGLPHFSGGTKRPHGS